MHEEMIEAFLAAVVVKLADGQIELDADDLLAVEGQTLICNDIPDGFEIVVKKEDE
jgi:hypothetical protein